MEAAKTILEKVLKIIIIICTLMGLVSAVLLMILHIRTLPIEIVFYGKEVTLSICMFIVYTLTKRFDVKYFKIVALIGFAISVFNLVGFKILIKLLMDIGVWYER